MVLASLTKRRFVLACGRGKSTGSDLIRQSPICDRGNQQRDLALARTRRLLDPQRGLLAHARCFLAELSPAEQGA